LVPAATEGVDEEIAPVELAVLTDDDPTAEKLIPAVLELATTAAVELELTGTVVEAEGPKLGVAVKRTVEILLILDVCGGLRLGTMEELKLDGTVVELCTVVCGGLRLGTMEELKLDGTVVELCTVDVEIDTILDGIV